MPNDSFWLAKLAAWVHDPAEKAFALFHDRAGHAGGTSAAITQELSGPGGITAAARETAKLGDHWAAAADRPQMPTESWARVDWVSQPLLIHTLSGEDIDLGSRGDFRDLELALIKAVSLDHLRAFVVRDASDALDARRTALAFWRFAPNPPARELGELWSLLPAETRIPDHSIWSHLSLTSAFAGCFAASGPALLSVSIGPVQGFIAQARTSSDLWAGSHLLSRLAWEGLRVIAEELGPDCFLFPQLRGLALADQWLRDSVGLKREWFEKEKWTTSGSDANPFFAAALPNKFVALVPAAGGRRLVEKARDAMRKWAREQAEETARELGFDPEGDALEQVRAQLEGFPEVEWSLIPWSLASTDRPPNTERLARELRRFIGDDEKAQPGFLGTPLWSLLSRDITVEGAEFYRANAGTLYPAVHDLGERALGAAKSLRAFAPLEQKGYRCTLCGEREPLASNQEELKQRQPNDSLWTRIGADTPHWAKEGERLCALCALKRLWPGRFSEWVGEVIGKKDVRRFAVSTHTVALATSLGKLLEAEPVNSSRRPAAIQKLAEELGDGEDEWTALPRGLADQVSKLPDGDSLRRIARALPARLDRLRDEEDEEGLRSLESRAKQALGHKPEGYYALILMDGDRMGAWLSGHDEKLKYVDTFHPKIRGEFEGLAKRLAAKGGAALQEYLQSARAVSPARHAAISAALNAFAVNLAPLAVEEACKGKLLYAGGDDVLALVAVDDALDCLWLLRMLFRGADDGEDGRKILKAAGLSAGKGFVGVLGGGGGRGRLFPVMSPSATVSAGLVIAQHRTPLGYALRELRAAEARAKGEGGRDAFSITLLKRAGSISRLTCPWSARGFESNTVPNSVAQPVPSAAGSKAADSISAPGPMPLLRRLRDALAGDLGRRAAYHIQDWLEQLPAPAMMKGQYQSLLRASLAQQLGRQWSGEVNEAARKGLDDLAGQLAALAAAQASPPEFLRDFITTAEFLARESRAEAAARRSPAAAQEVAHA